MVNGREIGIVGLALGVLHSLQMKLTQLYRGKSPHLSIEIFPPKTEEADGALVETLKELSPYQPAFISCTYGAGGSTRDRTLHWCEQIQKSYGISATAHFTCIGSTREQLIEWLGLAKSKGVENVLALRGDPPKGQSEFKPVSGGLSNANELVSLIRTHFPELGIGVAAYPEKHPEAPSAEVDLINLKRKVDAGADALFTQLFFNNQSFFDFQERCHQAGIDLPLIPGIMPITEFARIKRITQMCGATVPSDLARRLEKHEDDKEAQFEIGVEYAIDQCQELIAAGVPGIHFYALNRSGACKQILEALGVRPKSVIQARSLHTSRV